MTGQTQSFKKSASCCEISMFSRKKSECYMFILSIYFSYTKISRPVLYSYIQYYKLFSLYNVF